MIIIPFREDRGRVMLRAINSRSLLIEVRIKRRSTSVLKLKVVDPSSEKETA